MELKAAIVSKFENPIPPSDLTVISITLLENAGGMARELAALDSESPTKQNG